MLQRLYVNNFRCLEDFELNLKDMMRCSQFSGMTPQLYRGFPLNDTSPKFQFFHFSLLGSVIHVVKSREGQS